MDIEKLMKNLKENGFDTTHFLTGKDAVQYLNDKLDGKRIGMGDSITLAELGLYQTLSSHCEVYWHTLNNDDEIRAKATKSPVYLTSANAISENGEIVNIDGCGNRIAATLYEKDEVYIIVGTNKIVENIDTAIWRARNIAAPRNAQRLKKNTPCAVAANKCYDCTSKDRICNGMVVLWKKMRGVHRCEVILINGNWGL